MFGYTWAKLYAYGPVYADTFNYFRQKDKIISFVHID